MNKILVTIAVIFILSIKLFGIDFPKAYTLHDEMHFQDSNSLYFNFYNCNFLWNNEFFNDVVEGYTLIGYFITPTLQYHFNKNIKIEVGAHFLKYSGLNKYSTISPYYSATYYKKDFAFVMGTLYGTVNHRLNEPMYFFEQYFTNNLENGLQVIWDKNKFYLDIWLDWRSFIFENDTKQEELTAGISTELSVLKKDSWELSIPASLLLIHEGGQVVNSDANIKTAMNYSLGINIHKITNHKILNKIEGEFLGIGFSDNSPTVESLYKNGYGLLSNIKIHHKTSFLQAGFWYGNKFLSPMGHPMYQCFSVKDAGHQENLLEMESQLNDYKEIYTDKSLDNLTRLIALKEAMELQNAYNVAAQKEYHKKERILINAKLFYSKDLYEGINLGLMGEAFYDINSSYFDYTIGVTLLIKHSFFLKQFHKKVSQ